MHKEKVSGMSQKGFFLLGIEKEYIFWEVFLDANFKKYFKCQPT